MVADHAKSSRQKGPKRSRNKLEISKNQNFLHLKAFFAPHKIEARLRIHIALEMKLRAQWLRPTEEHTRLGWMMYLADTLENSIPIRSSKVCWSS